MLTCRARSARAPRTEAAKAKSVDDAKGLVSGAAIVVDSFSVGVPLVVQYIELVSVQGSVSGDVRVFVRLQDKKRCASLVCGYFDASANDIHVITSASEVSDFSFSHATEQKRVHHNKLSSDAGHTQSG